MESIGALLILVADVYAIVRILQGSASTLHKLIWCVVILALPIVGFIVWYLAGPNAPRR